MKGSLVPKSLANHLHQGDLPDGLFAGAPSVAIDSETMGLRLGRDPLCVVQIQARSGEPHVVQLERSAYDCPNLKALLLETSFPSEMQALADLSGHLTPRTLRTELAKFQRNGASVLLYHLKPAFVAVLKREVADLPVRVLELGDSFEL